MKFEMPNILEEKVEAIGGIETFKKAAVWEWWENSGVTDEDEFEAALKECKKCYEQVMEFKEQLELEMEVLDEDSTSLPS